MGVPTFDIVEARSRLDITIQLAGLDLLSRRPSVHRFPGASSPGAPQGPLGFSGGLTFGLIDPDKDLARDLFVDPFTGTAFSGWEMPAGGGLVNLADVFGGLFDGGLHFNLHTGELASTATGIRPDLREPAEVFLFGAGLYAVSYLAARYRRRSSSAA